MSFEEMIVALVGSIGAFALVGYLSAKFFGLIKAWINRKKGGVPEEEFNRLAKAFMSYKKESQRRLQNLEAIIADEDSVNASSKSETPQQIEAPRNTIEVKDQESEKEESKSGNGSNLRNMLRE